MRPAYLYRWIVVLCCCMAGHVASGQIGAVYIGVNGLTCSQCTRNVEMSIRRLPFVQDIAMDLQHTSGILHLKAGVSWDAGAIAKAVRKAGFSLRFLEADIDLSAANPEGGYCFRLWQDSYRIAGSSGQRNSARARIRYLGPDYMPAAEVRQISRQPETASSCPGTPKYLVQLVKTERP